MGTMIVLNSTDGHALGAYRAWPDEQPLAGILVIQEIFGVNAHIRDICDRFAAEGYAAIAPALFDRVKPGIELDYDEAGIERGRAVRKLVSWRDALTDLSAGLDALRPIGPVGAVGFCWGGSLAWLTASRLRPNCAVGYYGGQIAHFAEEVPRCPVMLHFGGKDTSIPMADIDAIRKVRPEVTVHQYLDAGHGFNCDRRASFHADAAALSWQRTLEFLAETLG